MERSNNLAPEVAKFINQTLKRKVSYQLDTLLEGYRLTARSEGKSQNTIDIVSASIHQLERFYATKELPLDVANIDVMELRQFIVYLQEQPRFAHHPFTPPQDTPLAGHTVNGYLRGLCAFWAWLTSENFINDNPFTRLKIPHPPQKVTPIFTDEQLHRFFGAIDTSSPAGYRDYTMNLTLLDTMVRCSELTDLRLDNVNLENRTLKVRGKGSKERTVPIGAKLQKYLWKYLQFYRPEPAIPRYDQVFLTLDGHPLTKDRLEAIVKRYGIKAGITGVRVSPHTFRHTSAVMFLRNGGDVFSLQRILGHSRIETVGLYVNLAMSDVSRVHRHSSPVDNLELKISPQHQSNSRKSSRHQGK
ncbi:tyrosine-type recombinase/integrase [Chloroflexota bacterium]